jgi:hypothetical protein
MEETREIVRQGYLDMPPQEPAIERAKDEH